MEPGRRGKAHTIWGRCYRRCFGHRGLRLEMMLLLLLLLLVVVAVVVETAKGPEGESRFPPYTRIIKP